MIGGTSILGGSGGYTGTILGALILTVLGRLLLSLDTSEAVRQVLYGLIVLVLAWVYVRVSGQRAARPPQLSHRSPMQRWNPITPSRFLPSTQVATWVGGEHPRSWNPTGGVIVRSARYQASAAGERTGR